MEFCSISYYVAALVYYPLTDITIESVLQRARHPIKRNDDNETRDFILNMTPDQRKELGINKSTLWYIQKNLREGKKIKLYDKVKAKIV